ncbi:MAG: divalent-cation tolerance protein CutA [Pyrinomonadaceae bacterium MAG19_C2-C3]|nr:divalent-cation tolerance protein CutA [Pyrinomonadaceae bacterium MAG19_C2-C3]
MMQSARQPCVVMITAASQVEAQGLARLLIEERLAACVQILPAMHSLYMWQGSIEQSDEILLLVKTMFDVFPRLEETIKRRHSYDTPEIIALPIIRSSAAYLSWMMKHVSSVDEKTEREIIEREATPAIP